MDDHIIYIVAAVFQYTLFSILWTCS